MGLRENTFKEEYRTGDIDLVEVFYRPCLKESVRYDRAVGYFRSSVFLLVGRNFLDVAKKERQVRLICSPCLTEYYKDAIIKGYKSKKEIPTKTIRRGIGLIIEDHVMTKSIEVFDLFNRQFTSTCVFTRLIIF